MFTNIEDFQKFSKDQVEAATKASATLQKNVQQIGNVVNGTKQPCAVAPQVAAATPFRNKLRRLHQSRGLATKALHIAHRPLQREACGHRKRHRREQQAAHRYGPCPRGYPWRCAYREL